MLMLNPVLPATTEGRMLYSKNAHCCVSSETIKKKIGNPIKTSSET